MSRYDEAVGMAMDHAKFVGESPENWTGYLNTAARMYQYPFMDALLIHAQRPDATVCAELPAWNDRMNRWVNRGSKGIMLVDRRGARPGVRYVFDMKDTHTVRGGRDPVQWKIGDGQENRLLSHLKAVYHLTDQETKELPEALFAIAGEMAVRAINVTYQRIAERYPGYARPDVQAGENDRLFDLMESSMAYMLFVRCGLDPKKYMDADEFDHVAEFATPFLVASIGTEVQKAAREVLKDIGQTVLRIQREDQQRVFEYRLSRDELVEAEVSDGREGEIPRFARNDREEESDGNDIRTERGLSVSGEQGGVERGEGADSGKAERDAGDEWDGAGDSEFAEPERGDGAAAEQVREDAGELSQGESGQPVSDTAGVRGIGRSSDGDWGGGAETDGRADGSISVERTRTAEVGDAGVDGTYEQREGEGGGDRAGRGSVSVRTAEVAGDPGASDGRETRSFDSALSGSAQDDSKGARNGKEGVRDDIEESQNDSTENASESDRDSRDVEIAAELSLPVVASMEVQRREIEQQVAALYAGNNTIPAEVVDSILREAGNKENSALRIIYDFMLDQPEETHTAFVKKEYGVGGKGLLIDGHEYSVWFDENGMEIASGRSVRDNLLTKAFLSWDEISGRINQLLKQGEYLPEAFLNNAWENEARECATNLCYMVGDIRDKETVERFFSEPALFEGGDTDKVNAVAERLRDAGFIRKTVSELEVLSAELQEEQDILRFRFHRPEEIISAITRVAMGSAGYQSRDDFSYEKPAVFVTRDEMDAFLVRNTVYSGQRRTDVYAYFCRHQTAGERAKYMKGRYGIAGSSSTALPGYSHFGYSYDGKGIRLKKHEPGVPEYSELVSWSNVAERIAVMIEENRYLTAEEYAHLPEFEREKIAEMVVKFYAYMPKEIERPFTENEEILYGDVLDEIALKLAIPVDAEILHRKMGEDLKDVIADADDRWAKERIDILKKVRDYLDGKYSIYRPEAVEETESEISGEVKAQEPLNVQLSIFDYMDARAVEETAEPEVKLKSIVIDLSPDTVRERERESEKPEASGRQENEISPRRQAPQDGASPRPTQDDILRSVSDTALDEGQAGETDTVQDERKNGGHHVHRDVVAEPDLSVAEPVFPEAERINFRITDDDLGAGGQKQKYHNNMEAIMCLKQIESEHRLATPEEQEILSRYVGWGGIAQAFDERNGQWKAEYEALKSVLTPEEYRAARASTLNAFYTPPTVIKAMYEALSNMGLSEGNVLEPSCGIGNFMGLLPDSMQSVNMYGVELDSLTGRIARQLYQKNQIAIKGFEKTDMPDNFFDTVIGNVPFGEYQVADPNYDRHHFLIHDYFIARSIDLVRPGGVIAVVVSAGTMDKQNESARRYFAQRADLLGAVRLPNNAFRRNANTDVVADILFFQKRDRAMLEEPGWVHAVDMADVEQDNPAELSGSINSYFVSHPEMVLGEFAMTSTQYGRQELTVKPYEGRELSELLSEAVAKIEGTIPEIEIPDLEEGAEEPESIAADPNVQNFSFAVVEDKVYFRENSRMYEQQLPVKTTERVKGMVKIRDLTRALLQAQLTDASDEEIGRLQGGLNDAYDNFVRKNGLISSTANKRAFAQDSGYCLISALEVLDENGELERKADIFTKRTIRKAVAVTSVDTASEALAVSIGEKAGIDLAYMAQLTGKAESEIVEELRGVIFKNPVTEKYETADEYLSGNVRNKLRVAKVFAGIDTEVSDGREEESTGSAPQDPAQNSSTGNMTDNAQDDKAEFLVNVEALERVQPKDLDASEIEVRLGAPWVKVGYIQQFMEETFETPAYLTEKETVKIHYASVTGIWGITSKTADRSPKVTSTYGTERANAYRLLEDSLNLKDTKIYDTKMVDGNEKRVLNKKETMLAQQKQEIIKEAFKNWIFRDIERREDLCRTYNELYNSVRPREYDGSHIRFVGMNPEIDLKEHQRNAIAHVLYGHNTLLAHCVGSGKTFEMAASAMESKRLGLCRKSLFVVPNHLTEQWGSEFLRLYPGANILVATKKDFTPANRRRFCSRIATGDYDAIIIGHTQFEKIPLSEERRRMALERQIDELELAIEEAAAEEGNYYTVKQMEKMRENLETKLERLNDTSRKDNVVTFEELGIDRLFVDESQNYKNLFLYTKMRNVAGISQTDAQKSSDMFMKCQYLDEITGGRGVTFATGTPISNSMVELYTLMRYLQYDTLRDMDLLHFDSWAASFGETVNSIELSPEGTGYRSKTRFSRFYNLPELMSVFKEAADIQTEDMLDLPVPELESITEVVKPSEIQKQMVESYGERAEMVRDGLVKPDEDNMLKITNDGRKCALDQRLLNPDLPDEPDSKVNRCAENVAKIWEETKEDKSTQMIFCDLSTPKADGSFNVYDDIRNKLVAKGIPEEEVAFIHEFNTELKKAMLFSKVRSGQVRVLMGSTQKLGAGTNVQDRLIALHHLDCPWRPSDVGRILRTFKIKKNVEVTDNGKIII